MIVKISLGVESAKKEVKKAQKQEAVQNWEEIEIYVHVHLFSIHSINQMFVVTV